MPQAVRLSNLVRVRNYTNRKAALVCAVVAAVRMSISGPMAPAALAVVPGCDSAHPTRIGGGLCGYPDTRALNALMALKPSTASRSTGTALCSTRTATHGSCMSTLRSRSKAVPTRTSVGTRTSQPSSVCLSANVRQGFIEVYPRRPPNGFPTDFTRFGEAAHYGQPITPNADNQILLRLPVRDEQGGNTGYVNGYITANGGPVPDPTNPISGLRIRAFTLGSGPQCGVEGLAASAEQLATSNSGTATFYRSPPLAAGRCGAATQTYSLQVTWLKIGQIQKRHIHIADGRGIRVDFAF